MTKRSIVLACCLLGACTVPTLKPSDGHIRAETAKPAAVPPPVTQSVVLPPPKPAPKLDTYSVVVTGVPVQELLFALARDAKLNVDIHPGMQGAVTLNAINQTLPQILSRISKQVDMRYEIDGPNLLVMPDTPYLRNYKVDYVNMSRDTSGTVAIATQIATTGAGVTGTAGAPAGGGVAGSNQSSTAVTNSARNHFWDTLVQNIKDILRETDKILPEGSSETVVQQQDVQSTTGTGAPAPAASRGGAPGVAGSPSPATVQTAGSTLIRRTTFREAASVIANPETGVLSIRATSRQHERIQEFLDQVLTNAKRQVLIEATVVEVQLNNNYQQGIDWQRVGADGFPGGVSVEQAATGTLPSGVGNTLFAFLFQNNTRLGNISVAVRLLETFGTVKVLSSPKISVINNQTALLKVVDNRVYFTIKADTSQNQTTTITTFTTTLNSVPVGFVMSVTPQISDSDTVLLNVRPTVSRITGFVNDPNPALAAANIVSRIPEIQTREMESVIKVSSGQVTVMGGLMQDSINNTDDAVPGIGRLPGIGALFQHRNDTSTKSELVIFLRPIVIRDASLDGDLRDYRSRLPDEKFFETPPANTPAEETAETRKP
ncbi:MAG: pilus (MSHA type) biogenesis protein MshL [Betaproteobacteria bacterium]|nr:pilus (MSHA type) biogenesis protein MshL [Betaproteobacteria bacterium]